MKLEDLDYDLPPELIAQHPLPRREDSRLLVIERANGKFHDDRFSDVVDWLRPGDALALNETRVRPARLTVLRPTGGRVSLLFVRAMAAVAGASVAPSDGAADARGLPGSVSTAPSGERWHVLARPARNAQAGTVLTSKDGALALEVVEEGPEGERVVRVARGDLGATLTTAGEIPLPPYIHRAPEPADRERYQTVFARSDGAVAAPTAGLHFTDELLARIEARGVACARLVLHVGPGTFRPITDADPSRHRMDEEYFEVPAAVVETLERARAAGGRVVAVGTTVVRALEAACDAHGGRLEATRGWTRKFILPPYRFRTVDALITNFHLPRTTLLLLVAAFTGEELLGRAYAHAVAERYRFYSYGDAMLVV